MLLDLGVGDKEFTAPRIPVDSLAPLFSSSSPTPYPFFFIFLKISYSNLWSTSSFLRLSFSEQVTAEQNNMTIVLEPEMSTGTKSQSRSTPAANAVKLKMPAKQQRSRRVRYIVLLNVVRCQLTY